MTTFDERERAFENMYVHEAEMLFRARARRDHKIGLWAAGLLGKSGAAAEAYAMEIVRADCAVGGETTMREKLAADLDGMADESTIRARIADFMTAARQEVLRENAPA